MPAACVWFSEQTFWRASYNKTLFWIKKKKVVEEVCILFKLFGSDNEERAKERHVLIKMVGGVVTLRIRLRNKWHRWISQQLLRSRPRGKEMFTKPIIGNRSRSMLAWAPRIPGSLHVQYRFQAIFHLVESKIVCFPAAAGNAIYILLQEKAGVCMGGGFWVGRKRGS